MSESENLERFVVEIGGKDKPPTKEEMIEWSHQQFEHAINLLKDKNGHLIEPDWADYRLLQDKPDYWLAFDAIEHLAKMLRIGGATKDMQIMLADYLTKYVLDQDEKAARAILGMPKGGGRGTNKIQRIRAIDAYILMINEGKPDNLALKSAWLAYHGRSEVEEGEEVEVVITGNGKQEIDEKVKYQSDAYFAKLESTIKPLLVKAGVRAADTPAKKGRHKTIK